MIRCAVFSDSHGHTDALLEALKSESIHCLICLGDHANDGRSLAEQLELPLHVVRGNCDWPEKGLAEDIRLELEGVQLLLTHGHAYKVKTNLMRLCEKAIQSSASLVLYGHTHTFADDVVHGIRHINPGSVALPRGTHEEKSWLLLEIDRGVYTYVRRFL